MVKVIGGVLAVFVLVMAGVLPVSADVFVDDLKNGLSARDWTLYESPSVGTVVSDASGTTITFYATWARVGLGLGLNRCVEGDFDAQVDYELLIWPPFNEIRVGTGAEGPGFGPAAVERISDRGYGRTGEVYLTHFSNGIRTIDTKDTSGTLRITRAGTTLSGYYKKADGTWQLINTSYVPAITPQYLWASVWNESYTPGVTVRFSNYSLTAESIRSCGTIEVAVDVKPGSSDNPVNVKSKGVIPVAVVGSPDFDATTIDAATVTLGPSGASSAHGGHMEDVNGDGVMDMLLHFYADQTGIACGDTGATLTGSTTDGIEFEGSDAIKTTGCK